MSVKHPGFTGRQRAAAAGNRRRLRKGNTNMHNGNVKKLIAVCVSSSMLLAAVTLGNVSAEEATEGDGQVQLSIAGEDAGQDTDESKDAKTDSDKEKSTEAAETESETETETETEPETVDYDELETTGTADGEIKALDVSDIVKNVMPSIVSISIKSVQEVESYFYGTQQYEEEGAGSGVIIAQNGSELLIATNNHVVEDTDEITVCFSADDDDPDDLIVPAVVKGTDASTDLAVVAVKLSDIKEDVYNQLKIATLGSSDDLNVGESAIVIGNALGIGQTVTTGIISALNRDVTTDAGTFTEFQTDAAVNLGCSGGAVLNGRGEVIGIVDAKATSDYAESMGYGIPIDTAKPVLQKLINRQTRTTVEKHGYLGVTVVPVSDEAKQMYNMPAGAFVYSVEKDSAADEAGIQQGDIITEFDGISIDSAQTLVDTISLYKVGETVDVVVESNANGSYESRTVKVTLQEGTSDSDDDKSEDSSSDKEEGNESGQQDDSQDNGSGDQSQDGSNYYGYSQNPNDWFNQFFGNGFGGYGYNYNNRGNSDNGQTF